MEVPPGEIFVHRNIANIIQHTDFNIINSIIKTDCRWGNGQTSMVICGHMVIFDHALNVFDEICVKPVLSIAARLKFKFEEFEGRATVYD